LRLPAPSEVGTELVTYVKSEDGVRVETRATVATDTVIARNPGAIGARDGAEVFNEWIIPRATAEKNYGEQVAALTQAFAPCKKQATLRALPLTQEILDALGVVGNELAIKVSWSDTPMVAVVGDYLTSEGYSISNHDMIGYEEIPTARQAYSRSFASPM